MEGPVTVDDLFPLSGAAGKFEGRLDTFCSGVGEMSFLQVRDEGNELFREQAGEGRGAHLHLPGIVQV